jgi:chromosome segregation ATPase
MTLSLTYDDLAERLGITRNAARVMAQRRKWSRYTSQEDGKARVRVPEDELERLGARQSGTDAEHEHPHDVPPASGEVEALKDHVRTLREMLDERSATHAAEVQRLQDQLQEAQAEAGHAKADQVRMARDVSMMFDELKTMADKQADLHADRARLMTELEQARRPWWKNILKKQ